jgi:hypothetical protein
VWVREGTRERYVGFQLFKTHVTFIAKEHHPPAASLLVCVACVRVCVCAFVFECACVGMLVVRVRRARPVGNTGIERAQRTHTGTEA